jgi:hypothetical protein
MNKAHINNEKQAAVAQLAHLDKKIETFLATREDNYKKATKVIKAQVAEFAKPLYAKRSADYRAVKPMKVHRAEVARIVANCDVALANIDKAEKATTVQAPVAAPVATPPPAPVGKKKAKKKSA